MDPATLLLLVAVTALVLWHWHDSARRRRRLTVPIVPGLPLLGNVIALGRGGVAFITKCRQQFGDVFCLQLVGQRMVFLFDPALISLFFKAPESSISFKPAVEQFTQRVYGLPSQQFFAVHEPLLATLRQLLVPAKLNALGSQLVQFAQPQLLEWQQAGKVELWSGCQRLVFASAGRGLFGRSFFERHGLDALLEAFLVFEGHFEIAASPCPHLLLPRFRASRTSLLSMFRQSLAAGDFQGTVVQQLLQGCGLAEGLWPNLLLAVMWASQANSMAALFWSLALLLLPEQADCRHRIQTELSQAVQREQAASDAGEAAAATAAMLRLATDRRSTVSRSVAEAVRLRLHSIAVRYVSAEVLLLAPSNSSHAGQQAGDTGSTTPASNQQQQQRAELQVPRGTLLAICPFESHHDAQLYPQDAWRFQPERQAAGPAGLEPGTVVPGIAGMAFGGGFWRCPGRFFAEMELSLLVLLVLRSLPGLAQATDQQQPTAASPALRSEHRPAGHSSWWDAVEFGLASSEKQQRQWARSADASCLLPACDLQRLVGFKVPKGNLWVDVASPAARAGRNGVESGADWKDH